MPRRRRSSRRIDDGGQAHENRDCLTIYKVDTWYPLLDILIQQLNDRFCSDSFQQVLNAERLLIKAATGQTSADELESSQPSTTILTVLLWKPSLESCTV
jgi:hypothetical protein